MDYQHLTKDRSLGFTDLSIRDLVVPVEDSSPFAYKSTGSQSLTSRLQSDRKGAFKGSIVFDVEFYPCTDIKWSPFETPESSFEKAKDAAGADDDRASTINEPLEETAHVEEDKEMMEHLAKVASGKSQIKAKSGEAVEQEDEAEAETDKEVTTGGEEKGGRTGAGAGSVEMTREQLLQSQSGVLVFNIMGGELARRNARLEVLFVRLSAWHASDWADPSTQDDGYWPTCESPLGELKGVS